MYQVSRDLITKEKIVNAYEALCNDQDPDQFSPKLLYYVMRVYITDNKVRNIIWKTQKKRLENNEFLSNGEWKKFGQSKII